MSTLQRLQNLHQSQQVANSDKNEILEALAVLTEGKCHLTFTRCPSHSGVCGNELTDVAAKEGATAEQQGVSHHYDSAKATKEPHITHERLWRKRRKSEPLVGKLVVVKEVPSLHQKTEERSLLPLVLAPQDQQSI